jgi:hypothetical protein
MTYKEACSVVKNSDSQFTQVVMAANCLADSPEATFKDLVACLKWRGLSAEIAALSLYQRTGRQRTDERVESFVMDVEDWKQYLLKSGKCDSFD